jgi:hypothetical protein
VRIDRATKWGNPFVLGRDGDRDTVSARYAAHLRASPDLVAALGELRGRTLACWCAPLRCHGDVLTAASARTATPAHDKSGSERRRGSGRSTEEPSI